MLCTEAEIVPASAPCDRKKRRELSKMSRGNSANVSASRNDGTHLGVPCQSRRVDLHDVILHFIEERCESSTPFHVRSVAVRTEFVAQSEGSVRGREREAF